MQETLKQETLKQKTLKQETLVDCGSGVFELFRLVWPVCCKMLLFASYSLRLLLSSSLCQSSGSNLSIFSKIYEQNRPLSGLDRRGITNSDSLQWKERLRDFDLLGDFCSDSSSQTRWLATTVLWPNSWLIIKLIHLMAGSLSVIGDAPLSVGETFGIYKCFGERDSMSDIRWTAFDERYSMSWRS